MHTYSIGWGKDMVASSVILLSQMGVWGDGRSLQAKLDNAFQKFRGFCKASGKSTSLTCFTLKTFKVKKCLAYNARLYSEGLASCTCRARSYSITDRYRYWP